MAKGNRKGIVPSHRMPSNRLAFHVHGKVLGDLPWQLFCYIAPHPVVPGKRNLTRIDVKSRTQSEVEAALRIAWHSVSARTCVRRDKDHAQFRTRPAEFSLLGDVGMGAGQSG